MTFVPAILPPAQKAALPPLGVAESIAASKTVAAYELAPWRKLHPKADLAVTFTDPAIPAFVPGRVRTELGYKSPMPVLDATVLTLVFGATKRTAPKQLSVEAYVFQGSFPKGFRATYLISTNGKLPKVISRKVLDKYQVEPSKSDT